jgi:hypothetical protein
MNLTEVSNQTMLLDQSLKFLIPVGYLYVFQQVLCSNIFNPVWAYLLHLLCAGIRTRNPRSVRLSISRVAIVNVI